MPAPDSPPARLLRAVVVGAWVLAGAVVAHVSQHGTAPSVAALVPVVAAASAFVWWNGSRRLRLPTVFALLLVAQVAVHLLSTYVHGHAMVPGPAMVVAHVLATGVTALGLAHAERLWWSWWERVGRLVRVLDGRVPVASARPAAATAARSRARRHGGALAHVVVRRGPPAGRVVPAPLLTPVVPDSPAIAA